MAVSSSWVSAWGARCAVVDDGVYGRGADGWFVGTAAPAGGVAVAVTGLTAEVAPATAVGHGAEPQDVRDGSVSGRG